MNNQVVPQGYKNSKVGIIPVEWEVVRLGDVSLKISDGLHSTPKYEDGTKYFFINGNNLIKNEIIIFNNTKSVSQEEYLKHKRDLTNKTILMSINGTIGNLAIYNNEEVVLGKSACYINIKNNIDFKYIYLLLSSNLIQASFKSELTGSTIKNLSLKTIKNTAIPLPPLKEQQKIAEILATWDNAISKQEELVKAKEELKKGLMQKLLSGEVRFREFYGEWEELRLSEILKSNKLGGNYKNSLTISNNPLIKMGNIDRGQINIKKIEYILDNENIDNEHLIKYGDLFFNTRNTLDLVGKVAIWRNELDRAFYNSNLMKLVFTKKVKSNFFMNYLFNSEKILAKLKSYATGTTSVAAIYTRDLKSLKIKLPSLQEQQKIAQVLSNAEKR